MDGPSFPSPMAVLQERHGVDYLIDTFLRSDPKSVTLCTLGPMTNIAMALAKVPEIAGRVQRIVAMGGAYFEVGNVTPTAEFNIFVDPEAADIVLRSGIPIVMVPLDVTHKVLVTNARLERIRALGNKAGAAVTNMLVFSQEFELKKYGWDGVPLHDPCVIGYVLRPDLFEGRLINVCIETTSPLTRGMTVADWWQVTRRDRNVTFLKDVDAENFFGLLCDRLQHLP